MPDSPKPLKPRKSIKLKVRKPIRGRCVSGVGVRGGDVDNDSRVTASLAAEFHQRHFFQRVTTSEPGSCLRLGFHSRAFVLFFFFFFCSRAMI